MTKKKPSHFFPYLLILTLLFFILFLASCSAFEVVGLGNVITEERQVSGIEGISVGSSINLIIEQTGSESIRIEATENIIPDIITEVVNGELQINLKSEGYRSILPIKCYVTVKDLNSLKVSSSASIKCDSLKTEDLSVEMASSSRGSLNVDATNLDLKIASSANLTISGRTDLQNTEVNSSGRLDASELVSKDCKIVVQSSGNASINVTENLEVKVNSSARVNYKGSPEINSDVSSGGSLNKISN